ncbi:ABC transporter permease [Photobacterium minamisatsumaniensis]|uniref:ABC transporter permease n=1 Tax=Photobacterium minamisatsumaniensis TaxID=2910233 RepID=UPI003D0D244D
MIHAIFFLTFILFIIPLIPGLLGLVLPAISWLPPLGYTEPNLSAFTTVANWPGIEQSFMLSLFTGLSSTLLALSASFFILRRYWNTTYWRKIERFLSPMLAMPHVAFAIGFAFLLAPSGWMYRLLESTGFNTANSFNLIQDRYGLGLLLGLAIKEIPFLLLMSISVLQQIHVNKLLAVANGLGYSNQEAWLKVILPQWLPKIRLPLFAVAAYGISVVDVALIIGPSRPSTLSVIVWQWFTDPDLALLPRAAVGACLLLLTTMLGLALLSVTEWLCLRKYRQWQFHGASRSPIQAKGLSLTRLIVWLVLLIPLILTPLLFTWSIAQRWRFPDLSPSRYSLRFWEQELQAIFELACNSIMLALISSVIALIMTICCLEYRDKFQKSIPTWCIAIPLITPQLSLLFGIQISTYWFAGQHFIVWVIWSHIFFVFPYMYLALDGPWRSYDNRLDQCAKSLGLTSWQTWWRVKRPLIMPAIYMAMAVGMSVSLAQYLPTQMLGAGRISTVTTEAVVLASGQDRRVTAIYGLLQGILPLVFFTIALSASHFSGRFYQPKSQQRSNSTDDIICGKPHYK